MAPTPTPEELRAAACSWPVHVSALAAAQTADKIARRQPYWLAFTSPLEEVANSLETVLRDHPEILYNALDRFSMRAHREATTVVLALSSLPDRRTIGDNLDHEVHLLLLAAQPLDGGHLVADGIAWGPLQAEPVLRIQEDKVPFPRLRWSVTGRQAKALTRPLDDLKRIYARELLHGGNGW